ncbi:MAG: 50S ribosomal protein L11 methyltransferase [Dehalococcoidia bacterium]
MAPHLEARVVAALNELASGVATEHAGGFIAEAGEPNDVDSAASVLVKAYFSSEEDAMGGAEVARELTGLPQPSEDLFLRLLPEEDWAGLWKRYFGVQRISPTLVVVPTWKKYGAKPGEKVITLDPGMAFGTGQHPTTRLCLAAIERLVQPGDRVLDVGAGSGILSVCAVLCGAGEVFGIDVDEPTVAAAVANAELNGVSALTHFEHGTLGERWPNGWPTAQDFDLVVANISARAVIALSPLFAAALRNGGHVLTSGFLEDSVKEISAVLEGAGFQKLRTRRRGEWRSIEGTLR